MLNCFNEETKIFAIRILRLVGLIYYVCTLGFRFSFSMPGYQFTGNITATVVDYLVDVFYLLDMITRLRANVVVPIEAPTTRVIGRKSRSQSGYRRSMHIIHAVEGISLHKASAWKILCANIHELIEITAFFPCELIALACGVEGYYFARANRFLRVKDYFHYWADIFEILHHFKIATTNYAIKRVLLLFVSLGVVGHIGACLFYAISLRSLQDGAQSAWVSADGLVHLSDGALVYTSSRTYRYLRSMYWSIQTLDTVGFGDLVAKNESETWFCIFFFYLSAFLIYYTIANLMEVVTNYDSARTAALIKQSRFDQYAAYRKLPSELAERVRSYYNHQWKLLKGVDEREIHAQLPPNVSQQVKQVVVRDLLVQVPALADLNKGLLNTLTDNIDSYVYNPKDVIIEVESRVAGMYIISRGEVLLTASDGTQTDLQSKNAFGIAALVKSYTSNHSYKAKNFAEILYLKGSLFRHITKDYMTKPEFDDFIRKKLKTHYTQEKGTLKPIPHRTSSLQLDKVVRKLASIIYPDSEVRLLWDGIVFLALVFYLTSLALLLALTLRRQLLESTFTLMVVGFAVDALFLIDLSLRCTVFGFHENGVIETSRTKIWSHFWSDGQFLVICEMIPLDLIIGFGVDQRLYAIFRLLKLVHLRKFSASVNRLLHLISFYTSTAVSFEMSRFIALYFMLFQLCHWAGCIWRLTADVGQMMDYDRTWLSIDKAQGTPGGGPMDIRYHSMLGVEYSRSIYWAVSVMSSVGFPDILASNALENAVIICVLFFGYLIFNTVLGAIATLMGSFNREKREFDLKVERIKSVLRYHNIPIAIENRIVHYFDHLWTRYNGTNEVEVLASLPLTLKGAVVQHVVGPLVTSIPFFGHCSEPMENMLLSMFEVRSFLDSDPLMIAGEIGKEMFIIEVSALLCPCVFLEELRRGLRAVCCLLCGWYQWSILLAFGCPRRCLRRSSRLRRRRRPQSSLSTNWLRWGSCLFDSDAASSGTVGLRTRLLCHLSLVFHFAVNSCSCSTCHSRAACVRLHLRHFTPARMHFPPPRSSLRG